MTPKISPADLVFIRRVLNKSQENVAQMCSTSQVTWSRWERGVTAPIPVYREKILALLEQARKLAGKDLCPVCRHGVLPIHHHDKTTCTLVYQCDTCGVFLDKDVS